MKTALWQLLSMSVDHFSYTKASTTGQSSKTYLQTHHELLQEMQAKAYGMALAVPRLDDH